MLEHFPSRWIAIAALAALTTTVGCRERARPDGNVYAQRGATAAADGRKRSAAPAKDDDDHKDYWKDIQFDAFNFEEVTDYVGKHYIDRRVEKKRAWIAAANAALGLMEPSAELLPTAFVKQRKGAADEEGRLDGETAPFKCGNLDFSGVVLHKIPGIPYLKHKRKKRPARRLTDEEILSLRAKQKTRYRAYRDAWKPLPFGEQEFRCVMGFVKAQLPQAVKTLKSQRAAAKARYVAKKKTEKAKKANKADAKVSKSAGEKANAGAKGEPASAAKSSPKAKVKSGAKVAKGSSAKKKDVAKATAPDKAEKAPAPAVYAPPEYDPDAREWLPDMNRAWLAASTAFLHALDPHSAVIPRRQWDDSTRKTQDSSFEGIGAVLTQRQDRTIVENPMENLPAWKAGVRAGDEIMKVDGVDIRGWLLGKVVKRIRGKKHTIVVLTIAREGEPKPIDIPIKRAHIPIKNVTGKLLKDFPNVAHVKMTGFVPRSATDLRGMIERLRRQAPKRRLDGLILDLRRNSGGLLNRAIDIADMFLKRGVIVSVKSRIRSSLGRPEVHRADDDDDDYKMPLVVLVDDGSASASEIVASAIQENGRGLVVGQRTFGKASVQTLFEPTMHPDYYIKLTVARYYAPSGRTIQVTGVHPDVDISAKPDGKTHVGFREENLTNHLEPIDPPGKSPMSAMLPALNACVKRAGKANKIVNRKPRPQIAPDYQLLRAADYLRCLARLSTGK